MSKHAGKRKLKIRNCRARLSLLAEEDFPKLPEPEENDTDHILLPIETEKVGDYKNPRGKWSEPLFPPPKSSNYLINGKGTLTIIMSPPVNPKLFSNIQKKIPIKYNIKSIAQVLHLKMFR